MSAPKTSSSTADLTDEVRGTLNELRRRGYKLSIGSSSKNTKFILGQIGLGDFFDAISDGTDITRSKPDPEVFLKSAEKIGIAPADCAVVEDAKAGIEAAKAGGMTALALFGDAKGCGLEDYTFKEKRPALKLKDYLLCPCGGALQRIGGATRRTDTLYLKCVVCGTHVTILDEDLLAEVSRQMAEHDVPNEQPYVPDGKVIRLANAINRSLEHPDVPEKVVSLILQGVSARYNCCPAPTEQKNKHRLSEADLKRFGQAVSHITITGNLDVTVHFR